MMAAIVTGAFRWKTGIPFPTAMFLLLGITVIGIYYRESKKGFVTAMGMMGIVAVFEIGLVISVFFSYDDEAVSYIIAYNLGLLLFYLFNKKNVCMKCFKHLGEIGYAFFLGACIPTELCVQTAMAEETWWHISGGSIAIFCSSLLIAFVVTRYIEKPILKFGKLLERRMSRIK